MCVVSVTVSIISCFETEENQLENNNKKPGTTTTILSVPLPPTSSILQNPKGNMKDKDASFLPTFFKLGVSIKWVTVL